MLIYDFIERRFDDLKFYDDPSYASYMVDLQLNINNRSHFGQEDLEVSEICYELQEELRENNEDIPF